MSGALFKRESDSLYLSQRLRKRERGFEMTKFQIAIILYPAREIFMTSKC